jgi:16S rRNA (uracil1498-N3)-methyltransferase
MLSRNCAQDGVLVRSHRAFVPKLEPRVQLSGREFDHLRVLRAGVGDRVTLFDGAGLEAEAVILEQSEFSVTLEVGQPRAISLETPQPVTLAVALLKGDKLAEVVRACTELGVSSFQLLVTEFSDVREIGAQKLERLRRIALEAAKQCRRSTVPDVLGPIKIASLPSVACGLVAHPGSSTLAREVVTWDVPTTVATGPEGGFSSLEIALLEGKGFVAVGLGPRILRAETAPIALVASVTAGEGI